MSWTVDFEVPIFREASACKKTWRGIKSDFCFSLTSYSDMYSRMYISKSSKNDIATAFYVSVVKHQQRHKPARLGGTTRTI